MIRDINPKGDATVESHPCAKNAQGWGTRRPARARRRGNVQTRTGRKTRDKTRESEIPAGDGYLGRDSPRADLTFLTCSSRPSTLTSFSSSLKPISSICSSRSRAIVLSPLLRVVRRFDSGGGTGSADILRAFSFVTGDTLVYLTTKL